MLGPYALSSTICAAFLLLNPKTITPTQILAPAVRVTVSPVFVVGAKDAVHVIVRVEI